MMDPKELFAKAVEQAAACIRQVEPAQLGNPTPCTEWDLRALLNHMVYELLWVPEIVRGKMIAEVGSKYDGDVLRSDVVASWNHAADAALIAVKQADLDAIAHLSYGDVSLRDYILEVGTDMAIHGWDAGQGMWCTVLFNPAVAETIYKTSLPKKDSMRASGQFGEPRDAPAESDLQTKLLALFGRDGSWQQGVLPA
jgi:uncharacterized protein (TIGR03086 family)